MAHGTLGVTRDHRDLSASVQAFADRHITSAAVREAVDARAETLPKFWPDLAAQGLLGLHLDEDGGGAGFGLLETAVIAEVLGRAMAPGPFLPTVIASATLQRAGHRPLLRGLADGSLIAGVALDPGTLTVEDRHDGEDGLRVSGVSAPVLGGQVADVFVVPAVHAGSLRWLVLQRDSVSVECVASHDLTRRLALLHVSANLASGDVLDIDQLTPRDIAATLFAAEASGLAEWGTQTAAAHARAREQFGRPIGQFQGVKHRCARMLASSEQARVCAWDAARAHDEAGAAETGEASIAAAVAGAMSVQAAFDVAKDTIQTLGGTGFTWEHDAGLYLRRSQTLRILLGAASGWHRRVAQLTMSGVRRQLSVELPPEAELIRTRIRAELAPARGLDERARVEFLAERGYTAPHLPAPWGKDADAVTQLVIGEELRAADLEPVDMIIGNWLVPTLLTHGSREQLEMLVPPSLRGDVVWCQLFSEPGAGSDLANLSTRAEKVAGGWRINGQKVWTSLAREAHFAALLARTDTSVPRHRGLSYFIVDMHSEGVDVRPLRELTGDALFNEVFLDDVFVPDDMLVGDPGDGWKMARTTLNNERVSLSSSSSLGPGIEALLRIAGERPDDLDVERLSVLGDLLCGAQSGGLFTLRSVMRSVAGDQTSAESSVAKTIAVAHQQKVWEVAMEWTGPDALVGPVQRRDVTWFFLNSPSLSIAGGTTDIQLNIIGERLLGLPRDPEPGK
jgi:alkylation response protein AidB-like acyl-CoA dehydrogenase